jgi:hypothetical protein
LGLMTPQIPRPVAQTLREAEAAGNTSDVDVEQQLLSNSAAGDVLPDCPLPNVRLPDVPLPNIPLPALSVPEARPNGTVGEE